MPTARYRIFPQNRLRLGLMGALLGCALFHAGISSADTAIAVVVHKDSEIPQLSRDEVAKLFLNKRKFVNDVAVVPIDSNDETLRERFYLTVADMTGLRVKAYWSRIVFSGSGRPPREVSIIEC